MKRYRKDVSVFLFLLVSSVCQAQQLPYQQAALPVEVRVDDLLQRMTLDEKIAQIRHVHSWDIFNGQELDENKLAKVVGDKCWGFVEGFPLTGENCRKNMRKIQEYMLNHTRLRIPCFNVAEALHGSAHEGSTIYPQNIALGSTFNPDLAYRKAKMIAGELHAQGMKQILAPCVDVVRDLRWGRVEESYGEDPFLCGLFGIAEVKGYQEQGISPMLKHFGPHGNPLGGLNLASVECGVRDLHDIYLKPFEMIIKSQPLKAVMSTYNSWNRIPNSASHYLLTDVLRKQWGFTGYVYSDWGAIEMLQTFHHTANSPEECALQALMAGLDVEASSECYPALKQAVKEGWLPVSYIDEAVRRVLTAKFETGLFEDPFGEKYRAGKVHSEESVRLAREIADESVVLLKNEGKLLPLDEKHLDAVAVIGPNADQVQFGDYTWSRSNKDGVTPLQGIRRLVGNKVKVHYAKGCDMMSPDTSLIATAVEAARKSDVAILFVGSSSASLARDYSNTNCGEGFDLNDLTLTGAQSGLIKAVYATGTPVVLVLVSGKPFVLSWEKEHIPAILAQWYAGEQEGNSIADILFGRVNPSGHLTFSFPQSTGHLPVYYNHLPSDKGFYKKPGSYSEPGRDYVFSSPAALWSFGHGLSYTDFVFEGIDTSLRNDSIYVKCTLRNVGNRSGKEVVQLYVRDLVSSVVMPVQQLKAFEKVGLKAGESSEVQLSLPVSELAMSDNDGKRVIEPGAFEFQLGNASDRILLRDTLWIGKEVREKKQCSVPVEKKTVSVGKKIEVRGVVRDIQATLVHGVDIYTKSDGILVGCTDCNGAFMVEASEGDILVFRKKGYAHRDAEVLSGTLNIRLTYSNE